MSGGPNISEVQGRLVNKRALSKRLVFFELEREAGDLELVLKPLCSGASGDLDLEQVRCLKDTLRLGDVVSAFGEHQHGHNTFLVHHIAVLKDWKKHNPDISFVPRSLPALQVQHQHASASGTAVYQRKVLQNIHMQAKHKHAAADHPAPYNSNSSTSGRDYNTLTALCKQWINGGRCTKGDTCQYRHVQPSELPELRKAWVAARKKQKQAAAAEAGNPHAENAGKKRQRAVVVAEWLLATFGREALNRGSGVLDVAGGSGSLSFELQTVRGIRCTPIDPRPQKLSKVQRKWLNQHQQTAQSQQQCTSACAASRASEGSPSQLQSAPHVDPQTVAQLHRSAGDIPTVQSAEGPKQWFKCPVSQPKASVLSSNARSGIDAAFLFSGEKAGPLQPSSHAHSSTAAADKRPLQQAAEASETCSILDANTSCSIEGPELTTRNESDEGDNPLFNNSVPSAAAGSRADVQFQQPNGTSPTAHNLCGADAAMHNTHGSRATHPSTWVSQGPSPSKQSTDHLDMNLLPAAAELQGQLSHQIQAGFTEDLWSEGSMAQHLQDCSLVVGLHPDQATDKIVDFALQHSKPFAVVPCCVFPRLFAHRRWLDDAGSAQPVVSYQELIAHLCQKSGASTEYLMFEGMNQVVYRHSGI